MQPEGAANTSAPPLQTHAAKDPMADIIRWMNLGIDIEEYQLRIQTFIREMGRRVQRGDPAKLESDRRNLLTMIDTFLEDASTYMGDLVIGHDNSTSITLDIAGGNNTDVIWDSELHADSDMAKEYQEEQSDAAQIQPERRTIGLPSAFGRNECKMQGLGPLITIEMELRKGQAHDAIQKLREYIGKKSVLYRTDVRHAKHSQHKSDAARQRVDAQTAKINIYRLYYNRAREAMLSLAKKPSKVKEYKLLTLQDLTASTSLLNPSERGNRHRGLPWLWSLDIDKALGDDEDSQILQQFARLHWLRARCRLDRCREELTLLRHEMVWIPNSWDAESRLWQRRVDNSDAKSPGHKAFARRRQDDAVALRDGAISDFRLLLSEYPPPQRLNLHTYKDDIYLQS
ncbi:hypothetical protein CONPUDRAFT_149648 [Coniophora puteana RWD-64-598 SS2]|uniref:Uncharacterized protein n=1 Tax=Coniophora puteana (strain RWD-64-598) TaxID=741705 RepID=A0A5M3N085_CONPW|nr:uncharacterized protein CONPUDRAFT_149648 [Coniophora puteana RWD-64-598 SS2]EIW84778.1 hypothetical protein CONPUDRAFT_149648 [Coniophora puteana RWD-64-598 SS2]